MPAQDMDTIVSLAKRRGFIFPSSEIYGGLANTYEYGPNGVELKKNIIDAWWKNFIRQREDMVGVDTSIILHPKVWEASGHVDSFTDPLVEDLETNKRYRADHLIEAWCETNNIDVDVENMSTEQMGQYIADNNITSPDGNKVSAPKDFNILFETALGAVTGEKSKAYLRGETAQGIFISFKNIMDSSRVKLPFGVGQVGKSFRNEITLGQFTFRTMEFDQGEIEYFFDPETENWEEIFKDWQDSMWHFATEILGVNPDKLRWREHTDEERSHYSKRTVDLDYQFPFGFKELWGLAYRTDYDLKQHMEYSGKDLQVVDSSTGRKFLPHVIEPAVGLNRLLLMTLVDAYEEDTERNRTVLKLKPSLAPNKVAVFPLLKNKPELVEKAREIFKTLSAEYTTAWDDRGNIGKRYLAQDEIGTPVCLTIDFETLEDDSVTWRNRDTAEQVRVPMSELLPRLKSML